MNECTDDDLMTVEEARDAAHGERVRFKGSVAYIWKKRQPESGEYEVYLDLEDEEDAVEVVFNGNVYDDFRHLVDLDKPIIVTGLIFRDGEKYHILAHNIEECGRTERRERRKT